MTAEDLVNEVFSPYMIDDSMEVLKILNNYEIISNLEKELKDSKLEVSRELLKKKGIFKEENKKFHLYNHSFYSERAVYLIESYVKSGSIASKDEIKKLLENKIVGFFNATEWDKWNDCYDEPKETLAYTDQKKNSLSGHNTRARRRQK